MTVERGPQAHYETSLSEGRLEYQRCRDCAVAFHRPRVLCPTCGSADHEWHTASGRGEIHSITSVERPTRDWSGPRPPLVVLVDMEEGFRVVGRLAPPSASIGSPVSLTVQELPDLVFEAERAP